MRKLRVIFAFFAAAISGVLLATAFPPFSQSTNAWFALVPLFVALRIESRGFLLGGTFGLAFWLATLSWFTKLSANGGPLPLVILGYIGLAAWCSLFSGLFGFLFSRFRRLAKKSRLSESLGILILVPLVWCATEILRGKLFSGFNWNAVGVSQYRNLPLIQSAAFGGVSAVSFLVVMVNSAIAALFHRTWRAIVNHERIALRSIELTIAFIITAMVWFNGAKTIKTIESAAKETSVRVALIHPCAPSIFERDGSSVSNATENLLYLSQLASMSKPDLVVWPETSLPGWIPYSEEAADLVERAADVLGGTALIAGGVEYQLAADEKAFIYNSAFLFYGLPPRPRGKYRKQHLVPFGEFIPGEKIIPALARLSPIGFSCTAGKSPGIMTFQTSAGKKVRGACLICFENTVPALARRAAKDGAQVLISITNDAWFEKSAEGEQHLAQSVFRCVETRRPMLRASNGGVSAVIAPTGRILGKTDSGNSGYIVEEIDF